jgi:hypothetical protein
MQSFVVHELGPPSPEVLGPPSGSVSGGNVKGGGPPSPPLGAGAEAASSTLVPSTDETPESSGARGLPPLLPLPPPEVEHVVHASFPAACGSLAPTRLLEDPDDDCDGGGGLPLAAQAAAPRAASAPTSPTNTVAAPFFCGARITGET